MKKLTKEKTIELIQSALLERKTKERELLQYDKIIEKYVKDLIEYEKENNS